jgi:hypothetical protein
MPANHDMQPRSLTLKKAMVAVRGMNAPNKRDLQVDDK